MSSNSNEKNQPMDPTAREASGQGTVVRNVRNAYALDVLVSEVEAAFGEAVVTYGEPDGWQVIHDVTFEATQDYMINVLLQMNDDERVASVTWDDDTALVHLSFQHNRRIRDSREGFGVQAILDVYREDTAFEKQAMEPEPIYFPGGHEAADGPSGFEDPEPEPEPAPAPKPTPPPAKKAAARKRPAKKASPKS